jgi:hypothetical protein
MHIETSLDTGVDGLWVVTRMSMDGYKTTHSVRVCEHPLDPLCIQVSDWMNTADLKLYLTGLMTGLSLGLRGGATDCDFCRADLVDVDKILSLLTEGAYKMCTGAP